MKNIYTGLIIFALFMGLGFMISYNVLNITYIDRAVAAFFDSIRNPVGIELMRSITAFAETSILTPIIILSLLYFLLKKHWEFGVIFSLGIATAGYLMGRMKNLFEIIRPTPFYGNASGYSYPSGHVLNGAIVFLILGLYFLTVKNKVMRYTGLTVCALFIGMVGLSRMYLNVHWLSDVIGGVLLALSITLVLNGIVDEVEKREKARLAPKN